MPGHNIQYIMENIDFTTDGRLFETPEGFVFGWGTTVGNGVEGWSPGAIFIDTNAAEYSLIFRNVGTKALANFDVLGENAGEISVVDSNSNMVGVTAEAVLDEHAVHIQSAQAFLSLPIGGWTEQDGTALIDFADGASTTPGWSAGDETFGIRWNNASAPDPITTSVPIPPDLDASSDVIVHILAAKTAATIGNTVDWLLEAFNQPDTALYDADTDFGGTASSMTGDATAKTVQEETLTLASANVVGSPCILTLTLQPTDGKLDNDDVILLGVWLEYTRKVLTS